MPAKNRSIPVGPRRLHNWFEQDFASAESVLPHLMIHHVQRMKRRLNQLELDLDVLDKEITQSNKTNSSCKRLEVVPGIGRLTASALVATIGNGKEFKSGRQLSAWLGLVPKQSSSGGKSRLLGISKRGDGYLRRLFIHGARAVIRHMNPKRKTTAWLRDLECRAHKNVVIVALANKLARIAWSMLAHGTEYDEALI